MWADERGLQYEIEDVGDRQFAKDAVETIRMGLVKGSSFGFVIVKDEWVEREGKPPLRRILELKLDHVSPVARPANPHTSVSARDVTKAILERDNIPDTIRKRLEKRASMESTESPDGHHSEGETRDAAASEEPDPYHEAAAPEAVEVMRARVRLMKLRSKEQ